MKHLTLVILLALTPLSWGEDVYYCVDEHNVQLDPTDSGDRYELNRYIKEKFTFKYEADYNRLAVKGRSWSGNDPWYSVVRQPAPACARNGNKNGNNVPRQKAVVNLSDENRCGFSV